jgi:hypothetical protein
VCADYFKVLVLVSEVPASGVDTAEAKECKRFGSIKRSNNPSYEAVCVPTVNWLICEGSAEKQPQAGHPAHP